MAADALRFIDGLGLTAIDLLGHSMGGETAQPITLNRPELVAGRPRSGPARAGLLHRPAARYDRALFGKRDELGDDMWLPILFTPSKESQAARRAFVARIQARDRRPGHPVSAEKTIAAYRAAANGWGSAPPDVLRLPQRIAQPPLGRQRQQRRRHPDMNSYHLYQHLPEAELWLLPDSGHGAHFQYSLFAAMARLLDREGCPAGQRASAGGSLGRSALPRPVS